jgi:cytochrome c553
MKKIFAVVVVLAMTLVGANAAFAVIAGSKHDLSSTGGQTLRETSAGLSSCQFCHTPHGSNTTMLAAPLWNRTTYVTTYSVYGGSGGATGSTAAGSGNVGTPGPHSMTCLGCHDGIAGNTVGQTYNNGTRAMTTIPGTSGPGIVSGLNNIGRDLQNDHPVGIAFTNAAPNVSGLNSIASLTWYKFYQEGTRVDSFECGSCHDVHGFDFATGNVNAPFLRRPKATMCSECHSAK